MIRCHRPEALTLLPGLLVASAMSLLPPGLLGAGPSSPESAVHAPPLGAIAGATAAPAVPVVLVAPTAPAASPAAALAALKGAALSAASVASRLLETFSVNAQARTPAGHRSFPNVGSGKVTYTSLDPMRFRIQIECQIENPDNHQKYAIDLDMEYRVDGDRVSLVARHNHYSDAAKSYSRNIERAVPFIYLAKYLSPPAAGREPARTFFYEGTEYTLRYVQTDRDLEATLYASEGTVGKFFIQPGRAAPPMGFDKFRVPQGDVVLSFVFNP